MHNMTRPNNIRYGARHDKILMINIWYDIDKYLIRKYATLHWQRHSQCCSSLYPDLKIWWIM